jgi:hypothetical protein
MVCLEAAQVRVLYSYIVKHTVHCVFFFNRVICAVSYCKMEAILHNFQETGLSNFREIDTLLNPPQNCTFQRPERSPMHTLLVAI